MAEDTPFQHFFATLGQGSPHHAQDVNTEATLRLEQVLKSPVDAPGHGILLRAPRAGFGKTHLLARVQHRLAPTHEFIPLILLNGARLDPAIAVESALRRLTRQLPAGAGLTTLDLQARRLLSLALQPLVSSGEVPCQDRESALAALRQRPVETFDFHQPHAVTAHWTRENFEVLGPRLALELSRRTGSSLNETSFWLAAIFRFAVAPPDHPGRTGMIIQSATSEAGVERFAALMALLSQIVRVVLVADDLEGLHADPASSLRLSSFVAAVRQDAPRVDAIISVNDDIWGSSFEPALSGGLLDRLGEIEIRLGPLDDRGVVALLDGRTAGRGAELFQALSLVPQDRYSRRVLRLAAAYVEVVPLLPRYQEPANLPVPSPIEEDHYTESLYTPAPAPVEEAYLTPQRLEEILSPAAAVAMEPVTVAAIEEATSTPSFEEAAPHSGEPAPEPHTDAPAETPAEEPAAATASVAAESSAPALSEEVVPSPFTAVAGEEIAVSGGESKEEKHHGAKAPETHEEEPVGVTAGGDRIDDLLRQFRDRYGRE